jgi:hypothetical protein
LLAIGLQEKLCGSSQGPSTVEEVAALLSELGCQFGEVLAASSSEASEVAERLDRHLLLQELLTSGGAINTAALFGLLDWTSDLLARFGAPARDAAAAAAQAAVRQQLAGAAGDPTVTAAAAVRALRLLTIQLKMLRMDTGEPVRHPTAAA